MPNVRAALLALLLLALASRASGQVIAGTTLYVDHTAEEQAYVTSYQLCVATDCRDVGVTRVGTTATLALTVPAWVPRGRRDLTVRAVLKAPLTGTTSASNALSVVVVGGPDRLRTTEVQP